jgi:hypothetical protein
MLAGDGAASRLCRRRFRNSKRTRIDGFDAASVAVAFPDFGHEEGWARGIVCLILALPEEQSKKAGLNS